MEFTKLIEERRSIRKYSGAPTHEELVSILKNTQHAPSWANMHASRSYVVENEETLKELREKALPGFNQSRTENAAVIVSTYLKDTVSFADGKPVNEIGNGWAAYDLGLHDAYLILAAKDAGYDTLIMGMRNSAVIRELLNIPENEEILSVIAIGKRGQEANPRPRKELSDVAYFIE